MKIFLIERTDDVGYDEFEAFVIRAKDIDKAKKFAETVYKDGENVWYTDEIPPYKIKEIGETTTKDKEIVILGSFNAG